jgi:hypothetical protein
MKKEHSIIMKAEYTAEDFKNAKRNPFYEKLNREVTVPLRHEIFAIYEEIAKMNGETPEKVMRRCLTTMAKELKEHD